MSPASSWLEAAARRGILTSRYPARSGTADELPITARPPRPDPAAGASRAAVDACPVGAIAADAIDQGRCIRCARCLAAGFRFSGPVEASALRREALVEPLDRRPAVAAEPPPLGSIRRSIHVFLVDVGSCNACNLEVLALANPFYDSARLGLFFTNSPRHADVLLVVGVPTEEMVEPVRRAYDALPAPKAVLAVGACPISGGVFRGAEGLRPSLADVIPVDAFVPGCPPTPLNVLDGLLRLVGRARPLEEGPR
jgi:Ni,Fe-hydrogenase III small subunit